MEPPIEADLAAEPEATLRVAVTKLSGEPMVEVRLPRSSTVADLQQQIFEHAGLDKSLGLQLVHGDGIMDLDSELTGLGFQPGILAEVFALVNERPTFDIHVLANNHRDGAVGRYFHFHRESVSSLEWRGILRGDLKNQRSGERGKVVLWGQPNGGSRGDAHGRFDPGGRVGQFQFQVGDMLRFTQRPKSCDVIHVLADDHAHGPSVRGKYFHFQRSNVPWLEHDMTLTGHLVNQRTGDKGLAILWGKPNRGSAGNAHGRFDPLPQARPTQFRVGDELQFESC
mmetsp:Transcript_83334/g.193632  ORF Transcript_83334/g.193632 Transcript_83334/m.193632 type:complete len:283 (-) Transcript_83334:141-989(-)